jgi:hypothetical protein
VKCDEARPQCNRCISTGRKCDGYTGKPLYCSRRGIQSEPTLEINYLSSTKGQQHLTFFQVYAAPEFAGCFDSSFWQYDVLRASHHYPAIQAAIAGLGALYQKFMASTQRTISGGALIEYGYDALKHCNRAIQSIIQMPASPSDEERITILTVCVLFSCFATLEGDYKLAMQHFGGGLKLLNQGSTVPSSQAHHYVRHSITFESLVKVYSRLHLLARGIDCEQHLPVQANRSKLGNYSSPRTASFEQACISVSSILDALLSSLQDISNGQQIGQDTIATETEVRRLLHDLGHWEDLLLQSLPRDHTKLDHRERRVMNQLKMCRCEIDILRKFAGLWARLHYRVWDAMEREFEKIVELAGQLLEADTNSANPPGSASRHPRLWDAVTDELLSDLARGIVPKPVVRPSCSSTFGPVTALWTPATRCRSPRIRRKAIALLLEYPRTEGFVDSTLAGRIAWKSMMLEEHATAICNKQTANQDVKHIPLHARIEEISVAYTAPRTAQVEFKTLQQLQDGIAGKTTLFNW